MTLHDFQSKCVAWVSSQQASPAEFAALLTAGFEVLGMFQRDLAAEFEVAESTVSRWAKGTSRPHPRIQKQIVKTLIRRCKRVDEGRSRGGTTTNPGFAIAAKGG